MKTWIIAASSALLLAGCGGAESANNVATNAAGTPADNAAQGNVSAAPAPTAGGANVAIGRWVQAEGECDEMADVEFTATGVRMFGGPDGSSMDIPLTYRAATATSVSMQAEPGQPTTVATLRDPTHLVLTDPDRPERNCTLVRR
jgi:hypothetical protein